MSVGMVSATENVSMDHEVNNGNQNLAIDSDVDLISESGSPATFTELENDLRNAQNGIVDLSRDYKYDQTNDSALNAGIQVSKLTINGNGHKIDANGLSRIFKITSGPVILNNITFVNGHSTKDSDGGAILVSYGNLEVKNCQFSDNFAEEYGGAIASSSGTVDVYNTVFYNNTAKYHGGAIYAYDAVVDKSVFDSNGVTTKSSSDAPSGIDLRGLGGAIFSAKVKANNTSFKNNYVVNSGLYQIEEGGGAIAVTKSVDCNNCDFENNSALKGGAIFALAPYSSDFNPENQVNVDNSRFTKNSAYNGGAICSNYNVTTNNSVFKGNSATGYGGGAINTGYNSNNNVFENTLFSNNTANNYGGALSISHSHIKNCTFEYNKARHGGAIFSLSFDIAESVLHDNVATVGNKIIVIDGYKKDEQTKIPKEDVIVYSQDKVQDFSRDVLNGQSSSDHVISSGDFEGYLQYCLEQYLFLPKNSEGVITKDLSYITNAIDQSVVSDYLKIMFYLKDAYPDRYSNYDLQSIIWVFTSSDYRNSANSFVKDIIGLYDDGFALNKTTYELPNGTIMEYDMKLFLTPTDEQNIVLFKSSMLVPEYNETVTKETINKTVLVGEDVQFRITVKNDGNVVLKDVFVEDTQYDNGLVFKDEWYSEIGNWSYRGDGIWVLNDLLEPNETASFIIVFNTQALGVLENNVTSGYRDITLSNSTNTTRTYIYPKMSVIKISNDKVVTVGKTVSFTIIVKNDGDCDITGVYVIDREYTKGLIYDYFEDSTNSWKYEGNGLWRYDGVLKAHEQTPGLILYFLATTTGLKFNSVIAGNNLTNNTVNSTNTTKVIKENKTLDQPRNDSEKDKNETKVHDNKTFSTIKTDEKATGNPLFALLLVLISLGVTTFKLKK